MLHSHLPVPKLHDNQLTTIMDAALQQVFATTWYISYTPAKCCLSPVRHPILCHVLNFYASVLVTARVRSIVFSGCLPDCPSVTLSWMQYVLEGNSSEFSANICLDELIRFGWLEVKGHYDLSWNTFLSLSFITYNNSSSNCDKGQTHDIM